MRLKIITTAFMIAVLVLFVASSAVLGQVPPKTAPREVKRHYGVRAVEYLGALIFAFTGSGVCAYLVFKNAKEEYERESINNLKALLEASARDAKQATEEPQS